jgi:CxxC-x17-CxxC domain-containing protein
MSTSDTNDDWRTFQERVADLFRSIPGCSVSVCEELHGARIGTVEADVVARFRAEPTGSVSRRAHLLEFVVVAECKHWRTRVPQEKVFALKTIVEDVGAAMGILVSEAGVQAGAVHYLSTHNNIRALTYHQLLAFVAGRYAVQCSECGAQAILPFEPDPSRLDRVLCRDCWRERWRRGS